MATRKSSTAAEIWRSTKLKQKAEQLQRENSVLRESLRFVTEQLREERAPAKRVSRLFNPQGFEKRNGRPLERQQTRDIGLLFLRSELRLSKTFLAIALRAGDPEKRGRNLRNARLAYESLIRFKHKILMTKAEAKAFDRDIAEIKKGLTRLGEFVYRV